MPLHGKSGLSVRGTTLAVGISVLLAVLLAVSVSAILYDCFAGGRSLAVVVWIGLAIILLPLQLLLSVGLYRAGDDRWAYGWATALGGTLLFTVFGIGWKSLRDASPVVLYAIGGREDSVELFFRTDYTLKVTHSHLLYSDDYYGSYRMYGDTIVLPKATRTGAGTFLPDTLLIDGARSIRALYPAASGRAYDHWTLLTDYR